MAWNKVLRKLVSRKNTPKHHRTEKPGKLMRQVFFSLPRPVPPFPSHQVSLLVLAVWWFVVKDILQASGQMTKFMVFLGFF